ncbi:MAG: phage holin family protein [Propionicimonas sp.]
MIRMLIGIAVNLASAVLGLLVAAWLVEGVHLEAAGFITAVVVFTAATTLLGPFVFNTARRYASALLGGIGLVSTLLALWIATWLPGGLTISGWRSWVLAALVVWLVTALGGWFLLWLAVGRKVANRRANPGPTNF